MGERLPEFRIEEADGGWRVTDSSIQDAVFDLVKRMTDAKETALKEAIKSLGWIAPEDITAHDARIASEAAERALREAAETFARTVGEPAHPSRSVVCLDMDAGLVTDVQTWLRDRADRLRAEREGVGEGES